MAGILTPFLNRFGSCGIYFEVVRRLPSEQLNLLLSVRLMLNIRVFIAALCVILGAFSGNSRAQTGSQDADDWAQLQSGRNIFALREALETNLDISDGVRALAVAYVGACLLYTSDAADE